MKRIVAFIIVMVMCVSASAPVFASQNEEQTVFESEYQAVLREIDQNVRALPSVKDGVSEFSRSEMIKSIDSAFDSINLTRSAFYSTTVELANVLGSHDGLSYITMAQIMVHGYLAQSDATNQSNYSDAYRHSTWNYRATKDLGASSVKLYTVDYEWANQLEDEWQEYYSERYNYYYEAFYSSLMMGIIDINTIINYAQADADDYICSYKDSLQASCRDHYSIFAATFVASNIMDWTNNKIGRDYGVNYPNYTPGQMFSAALNANQLILDQNDVTFSNIADVWLSDWWYT